MEALRPQYPVGALTGALFGQQKRLPCAPPQAAAAPPPARRATAPARRREPFGPELMAEGLRPQPPDLRAVARARRSARPRRALRQESDRAPPARAGLASRAEAPLPAQDHRQPPPPQDRRKLARQRARARASGHGLPAPSGAALRAKAPPFGYLAPLGWQSDFTCIETGEGWLDLAFTPDGCTRRCVAHHCREDLRAELATTTFTLAVQRQPPPPGLLHHRGGGGEKRGLAMGETVIAACRMPPMPSRSSPPPGVSPAA